MAEPPETPVLGDDHCGGEADAVMVPAWQATLGDVLKTPAWQAALGDAVKALSGRPRSPTP
jgi:hypothetical protein